MHLRFLLYISGGELYISHMIMMIIRRRMRMDLDNTGTGWPKKVSC